MSAIHLCVIGCGSWSSRMHLPALIRLARTHSVNCPGVCDLDPQRAQAYARQLACGAAGREPSRDGRASPSDPPSGPEVFTDIERMLDACRPDGVLVLVPPPVAAAVIRLVAHRGVPFLTEKPPAPTAAEHRDLVDRTRGLIHLVAYNRRHAPYMVQARKWLAGQAPQSVTCLFSRHRRREADFTTTAVHAIDAVRYLAGDDYAHLRIEMARAGQAWSFFLNGWTRRGIRIDILITPDTASAVEHYIVRSAERTVRVAYPQLQMMDVPGFVERQEANRVVERKGPEAFDLTAGDDAALNGIVGEQAAFCDALREGRPAESTLAATLQTQEVREVLCEWLARGERAAMDVAF